jgi:hypothetical protein
MAANASRRTVLILAAALVLPAGCRPAKVPPLQLLSARGALQRWHGYPHRVSRPFAEPEGAHVAGGARWRPPPRQPKTAPCRTSAGLALESSRCA